MKKSFVFLAVVLLLVAFTASAYALDSHANIRADFYMFGGRNNPDAYGYAIFNWVKGQDAWNVSGEVYNMRPDNYTLSVGIGGTCAGNVELIDFTVGTSGYASFSAQVDSIPDTFDIARIYQKGNTCITELTAPEFDGSLVYRGAGRYKSELGRYHD